MIIVISITLFFLVLRFTVTLFNFISNPKLTRVNKHYNNLVSILIPARNEADNILSLLESIKQQDYKDYEVIVYDDESDDDTYQVCEAFAAANSNFSVIKGKRKPEGWTGKNHACDQLAKKAKGDYFLFLDADEIVHNGLINSAVHRVKLYKLGLFSLVANQVMKTPGEKTTVPLLHYLLFNLVPLRLVYMVKNPAFAIACGQFMLFDAGLYREWRWHYQVKDKVVEDVEIMRRVKLEKYNGEALLANDMIDCRMYHSYADAVNGFSKNALAVFNYNIFSLLVYILICIGGPMVVIMTLNFQLIFFMCGLILLGRVMISLSSRQNVVQNVLLHPVQMINLMLIAFLSIQKHLTNTNTWKGRRIV